jgi:hypothetical protein
MHLPRHMVSAHGAEPAHRDVSGVVRAIRGEQETDPSVPGQGTEARGDPGVGSGESGEVSPHDRSGEVAETAPRKPKLMDRLRSRRGRGRGGQHSAPVPGERPPKRKRPTGRRVALDTDISDIWGFAGRRLQNTPHFATGRMLEYQAPAAGLILDRAVAGTLPDRVLFQPLARNRDKYEDVAFLLAGPLLTFSITTTQMQMQTAIDAGDSEAFADLSNKLEMQREMFVWVAGMMLPRLAEGVEKAREKKAKADAVIAKAFPDLAGEDPVETFASMLFTPPNFEEAAQNGNGTRAPSHASPAPGGEGPLSF